MARLLEYMDLILDLLFKAVAIMLCLWIFIISFIVIGYLFGNVRFV